MLIFTVFIGHKNTGSIPITCFLRGEAAASQQPPIFMISASGTPKAWVFGADSAGGIQGIFLFCIFGCGHRDFPLSL